MPEKEPRVEVKKVWGHELWLVNRPEYCGKLLFVNRGSVSSYHCHKVKQETFTCLEGRAKLTVEGKDYDLNAMAGSKTIFPGEYHKFEAFIKTVILEVSTFHNDNDVIRKDESKCSVEES